MTKPTIVKMHVWFIGDERPTLYSMESDGPNTIYDIVTDGVEEGWLKFMDKDCNNVYINMDDVSQIKFEDECEEEDEEEEEESDFLKATAKK